MKKRKMLFILITGAILLSFMCSPASAERDPNATFETQGIKVTVSVDVVNDFTGHSQFREDESTTFKLTNAGALDDPPLDGPWPGFVSDDGEYFLIPHGDVFDQLGDPTPGQVQSTTVHTESTEQNNGYSTIYGKTSTVDTANKVIGQNNIQTTRNVQYEGGTDGRMTSAEKIVLDNAGQIGYGADTLLCPFGAASTGSHWTTEQPGLPAMLVEEPSLAPAFCNIVQAGSIMDIQQGSFVTNANERHVGATSDFPVTLGYDIRLIGVNQQTAVGSVTGYMNVHTQEGGSATFIQNVPLTDQIGTIDIYLMGGGAAGELVYTDTSTASGYIGEYAKSMQYQSGLLRV